MRYEHTYGDPSKNWVSRVPSFEVTPWNPISWLGKSTPKSLVHRWVILPNFIALCLTVYRGKQLYESAVFAVDWCLSVRPSVCPTRSSFPRETHSAVALKTRAGNNLRFLTEIAVYVGNGAISDDDYYDMVH